MPEDSGIALRFPGVDPVGRYSVIDMKLARRQGLAGVRSGASSGLPQFSGSEN